ncbi:MAG: stage III sporulation protein AB [Wujia sp.]
MIGAIAVITGGMLIGLMNANEMRDRVTELKEIERILGYIVGEIRYNHALLYEACSRVSYKCGQPFRDWLSTLSNNLKNDDLLEIQDKEEHNAVLQESDHIGENTVSNIWSSSLEILQQQGHLKGDDIIVLNAIGNTLGYLDIYSQQMGIDLEREHIHMHISNLDKDLNNRMKVAITMGILGGILLVTFLI